MDAEIKIVTREHNYTIEEVEKKFEEFERNRRAAEILDRKSAARRDERFDEEEASRAEREFSKDAVRDVEAARDAIYFSLQVVKEDEWEELFDLYVRLSRLYGRCRALNAVSDDGKGAGGEDE